MKLVKKVEEIDERKRNLQSSLKVVQGKDSKSKKTSKKNKDRDTFERDNDDDDDDEVVRLTNLRERLRKLEDQKQLKDILELTRSSKQDVKESKNVKDMINALSRLNSISSLLLKENDRTTDRVRELPSEIRNIIQDEIVSVKDLIEDSNSATASALRTALSRQEDREDRRLSVSGDTDVVILRALSKLNNIAAILLKVEGS